MSEEQSWVIQTEDLQIGTTLSFDLMDASGLVLHKAGMPINARLKERLKTKSIHSVTVRGASQLDGTQRDALLIDSFSPGLVKAIQESIESTQIAVRKLVAVLQKSQEGNLNELRENVSQFVGQASNDVAAALAVIALNSRASSSDTVEIVAKRSAKLSLLGVITSILNSDEPNVSMEIGLAGLLHDCSLLLHPEWFSLDTNQRGDAFLHEYSRHPIESAELLYTATGISKDVITMVTQVHEQADGTGYPRGMKLANTLHGATTLNLADAYLTMVEPIRGEGHVPSDALAYLTFQTANGKFCKATLRHLIQGMSIYPIGSIVLLEDDSKAIVIQGNPEEPLKPIVRLLQPGNQRIDLRDSNRSISKPYVGSDAVHMKRILKSQMHEIKWRTDR